MSLRMRLFILLAGLVALLVGGQWWMVRLLARDLHGEIGHVAFSVGESVVTRMAWSSSSSGGSAPPADHDVITTRTIRIGEIDGRLEVTNDNVAVRHAPRGGMRKAAPTEGDVAELVAQARANIASHPADGAGIRAQPFPVMVELDSPHDARFLTLTGQGVKERIPIPLLGISDLVEDFRRSMLLGSCALLLAGLALAAAVAHGA